MEFRDFFSPVGRWSLESGLSIEATAGGFLGFDFTHLPSAVLPNDDPPADNMLELAIQAMRERVQVINAFALCLHSATVEFDKFSYGGFRITHEDLVHYDDLRQGHGGPGMKHLPLIPLQGYLLPHPSRHGVVPASTIEHACKLLDSVLGCSHPKSLALVALTNHALSACKGHDFELAVASAWTACESLLQTLWDTYTHAQATSHGLSVSKNRRAYWSGRDFTASIIVEVMTLAGTIAPKLSIAIGEVRSRRNKWIHGVAAASYQDAIAAVTLARDLLHEVMDLDFKVAPSVGVSF
ncbi:hypothetical protein ABZX12_03815 [Kribbella sp. NPDC003505]|uniref:hypothetical protein n=1 Tax=Kribbella sp. NPDC003505 TaxID=3154448 RepID=UPI0033AB25B1